MLLKRFEKILYETHVMQALLHWFLDFKRPGEGLFSF